VGEGRGGLGFGGGEAVEAGDGERRGVAGAFAFERHLKICMLEAEMDVVI